MRCTWWTCRKSRPKGEGATVQRTGGSEFEHYMYVLECGDGSLYTGYATDVASRLAAHQAGRGAKYTKSHAPVRLRAQARFYSKQRAMSAEALFKRLSRERKERLLADADREPLEDVLRRDLPGFGEDTAGEFVRRNLFQNIDPAYGDFMARLIPTVARERVVGVRTPDLRRIAKALARHEDADAFLRALPHRLFEENQVHSFAIGLERDYDVAIKRYEAFLPHVDNWATCDQMPVKVLAQRPDETLAHVERWLASGECYVVRFAIGVLMRLYLGDLFDPRFPSMVAASRLPDAPARPEPESCAYYVDMMRAWYFAEALVAQERYAIRYVTGKGADALLDEWTRRKAIQKAIESRRVSPELKALLRSCR